MAGEFGAKPLMAAAVALVVGLAIGGLGPRSQVRGLQEQLTAAQEKVCDRAVGREIANVFRGRPWEGDAAPPSAEAEDGAPAPDRPPRMKRQQGLQVRVDDDGATVDDGGDAIVAGDPEEQVAWAKEAMELRRAQALAALREQAGASDEQMTQVDTIVDRMNDDLSALAEDLVATVQESGGEPSRREMMLFASETLDVLLESEDALFGALTPEQREAVEDEALDPMSFIDGRVVDVLMELDR